MHFFSNGFPGQTTMLIRFVSKFWVEPLSQSLDIFHLRSKHVWKTPNIVPQRECQPEFPATTARLGETRLTTESPGPTTHDHDWSGTFTNVLSDHSESVANNLIQHFASSRLASQYLEWNSLVKRKPGSLFWEEWRLRGPINIHFRTGSAQFQLEIRIFLLNSVTKKVPVEDI